MNLTIVGAGISGLSLAYFLTKRSPEIEITILEADSRPGGKILSDRQKGFLCEAGVNGFLDNRPLTLRFVEELGLSPLRSNDYSRRRFVYSEGRLHLIPETAHAFLTSGLLSPCGKARLIGEFFIPRGESDDETISSFAIRRLGREAYEKLIEPMTLGIFAGNAEQLSLRSCFPRIHELQNTYGSLFRALFKLQREAKKRGASVGPAPTGTLTSFYDGMEVVVQRLKEILSDRIVLSRRVEAVDREGDLYRIYTEGGDVYESDAVVLACPAYEASGIVRELSKELSRLLSEIPYPPVGVVCLGYRQEDLLRPLNGFGFLVPSREKRKILGCLWDSSIFPNRAPEGYVLLRTMVGGARSPEWALKEEREIYSFVLEELKDTMGIDTEPEFMRLYRHPKAIPQYTLGHHQRLQRIEEVLKKFDGLYLTGNAYRGVGFNDCIQSSYKLSERILASPPLVE